MSDGKARKIFDGRYEIVSIVGRGACSVVYHARHAMAPTTEVALKVLLKKQVGQAQLGDRLRKEALALVSCRHRYVVRLDDFHTVGDLSYLSMEYAPHSDLRKYTATLGPRLPANLAELFLLQSSEALGFVHKAGIVHRDLKPDNILIINPKECRLADFGVAVLPGEESSLEELRHGVGTMDYMAPEVLEGTGYDRRSDVYALAVTFYELLTGRHPFAGVPLAQQIDVRRDGAIPPLQEITPDVPAYLSKAIMQALRFDPAERFPTGKEFNQIILVGRAQRKLEPSTETAAPKSPPRKPAAAHTSSPAAAPTPELPDLAPRPPEAPAAARLRPSGADRAPLTQPVEPSHEQPRAEAPPPVDESVRLVANAAPPPSETRPAAPLPSNTAESTPARGLAAIALAGTTTAGDAGRTIPPSQRSGGIALSAPATSSRENSTSKMRDPVNETPQKEKRSPFGAKPTGKADSPKTPRPKKVSALSQKDPKKSALMTISIVVFFIILGYGNIFLKKNFNIDIAQKIIDISIGSPDPTSSFIPTFNGGTLTFPALPPGAYAGTMTGLLPGKTVPLSILSFSEQDFLVLLPGVEGWSPSTVAIDGLPTEASSIRISSNGFVIELSGQAVDDEVVGYFKNMLTGEEGEWRIRPIQR
jgi:serine/threonine-protein kinase